MPLKGNFPFCKMLTAAVSVLEQFQLAFPRPANVHFALSGAPFLPNLSCHTRRHRSPSGRAPSFVSKPQEASPVQHGSKIRKQIRIFFMIVVIAPVHCSLPAASPDSDRSLKFAGDRKSVV